MKSPQHTPTLCHVLHTLNVGGAEVLAREFAFRAADKARVVFACLDEPGAMAGELRDRGFVVESMSRQPGLDFGCARRLARFFREQHVELVHAHQYAPFFYAQLARRLARGPAILFTEHGRDYPDFPRSKRKFANRLLLRRCDKVVGVGQCVRRALVDNEGFPPNRVGVIYNGVDLDNYAPERPDRDHVRRELRLDPEDLVIMQVARLNRLKDHPTAIKAMTHVVRRCPGARLVIIGAGEEREPIEDLITALDLRTHVRLLGSRNDVPRLLQGADVFLLSSLTEGIPLTLIEAMATSLPCVATRVGGNAEVVLEGETGLLAPASDPAALAECLAMLCDDSELRDRFGAAGRRRAKEHFDARIMHTRYAELYGEMLGTVLAKRISDNVFDADPLTADS